MRNISTICNRVRADLPITDEESAALTEYLDAGDRSDRRIKKIALIIWAVAMVVVLWVLVVAP